MRTPALALLALLTACAGVPRDSRAALEALDPLRADPAGLAVALTRDADLPLNVRADLALSVQGPKGAEPLSGQFALERTAARTDDGRRVETFRIAPDDLEALSALQAEAAARETADPDGVSGSLSVTATACLVGPPPPGPWPVDVALRTAPDGVWLPLVTGTDLRRLGRGAAPDVDRCATP